MPTSMPIQWALPPITLYHLTRNRAVLLVIGVVEDHLFGEGVLGAVHVGDDDFGEFHSRGITSDKVRRAVPLPSA